MKALYLLLRFMTPFVSNLLWPLVFVTNNIIRTKPFNP